jgi:hypothetical protein
MFVSDIYENDITHIMMYDVFVFPPILCMGSWGEKIKVGVPSGEEKQTVTMLYTIPLSRADLA